MISKTIAFCFCLHFAMSQIFNWVCSGAIQVSFNVVSLAVMLHLLDLCCGFSNYQSNYQI